MNKYINMFNEYNMNNEISEIIRTLKIMNKYILSLSEKQIDNEKKELSEFFYFFMNTYGKNEKLFMEIYRTWHGNLPPILHISSCLARQDTLEGLKKFYNHLVPNLKQNVDTLTEYIWNTKENRVVIIHTSSGPLTLRLPKEIQKEILEFEKNWLQGHIALAITDTNAQIVFRQIKEEDKDIVSGFVVENCKITILNKRILKLNIELQPDGRMHNFDNDIIYQEAECVFV